MKPKSNEFESLGLKGFIKNEPETVDEYDQLAGEKGRCLADALDYSKFHHAFTGFRDGVMDALIVETSIEPLKEQKKDSKGQPVFNSDKTPAMVIVEKPKDYLNRVLAETGKKLADFQPLATAVCEGRGTKGEKTYLPVLDYADVLKESVRGPKTPPKTYVETAATIRAKGDDSLTKALRKMRDTIGGDEPLLTPASSDEDIAWQIQRWHKAKNSELVAEA